MKRALFHILASIVCAAHFASCAASPAEDGEPRYQKYQTSFIELFDTTVTVIGYTESQAEFDRFADIVYDRMERLHRLYDIYHEYDGLNNLYTVNKNAGIVPVAVDKDIIDMLLLAREGYELSGGVVNIALGPVLRIWSEYRSAGMADEANASLPAMDALQKAALDIDIGDLDIDEAAGTVFFKKSGMSLDVGSVAKAYATQLAVRAAADAGMRSLLVNSGGNIVSHGRPLDGARDRWSIGVVNPDLPESQDFADIVYIIDQTVSCSGGYQRFYTVNGQTYHHIIDPATLMPANRFKQVAVIHENAGLADLLSTALFIMPYEEGAALAEMLGAEALWIDMDGVWRSTDGYANISQSKALPAAP
ncbi:MAG: FAD:protein FMN transferase [Oscillospiraceae bacterium]|jgi:thiamine biosynthesis lipoprotein|nr:FAD:protein FMN transferase [Oscillospiraceae bacterium]